jgi:hypothetical protein
LTPRRDAFGPCRRALGRGSIVLCTIASYVVCLPTLATETTTKTAIVCFVEGAAVVVGAQETPPRELVLLDRVSEGDEVQTGDGSRLVLTFVDGHRFELSERAVVVVGRGTVTAKSGKVDDCGVVPVVPRLATLAAEHEAGLETATTRIRNETKDRIHIEPAAREVVLADNVVLRFSDVAGANGYRVQIEDHDWQTVFTADTVERQVQVPAGTLQPGQVYFWSVRSVGQGESASWGVARFGTLDQETASRRTALEGEARRAREADLYVLLAEIDRTLGMHRQACGDLRAAGSMDARSQVPRELLDDLGCDEILNTVPAPE